MSSSPAAEPLPCFACWPWPGGSCFAWPPVNTGMVGYADILGPLVIIALVLGCMHLAEKRASRQTKG